MIWPLLIWSFYFGLIFHLAFNNLASINMAFINLVFIDLAFINIPFIVFAFINSVFFNLSFFNLSFFNCFFLIYGLVLRKEHLFSCLCSFFETRQEIKMYFPKIVRISESNQLEWDIDRNMLQQHGLTVMQGIGAAVENLDDSRFLNGVLFTIGQSHVNRHIKPNMLKVSSVFMSLFSF